MVFALRPKTEKNNKNCNSVVKEQIKTGSAFSAEIKTRN